MRATGVNVHMSRKDMEKLHNLRNHFDYTTIAETIRKCVDVTYDKEIIFGERNAREERN